MLQIHKKIRLRLLSKLRLFAGGLGCDEELPGSSTSSRLQCSRLRCDEHNMRCAIIDEEFFIIYFYLFFLFY